MRSSHKQLVANKTDSRQKYKQTADQDTQYNSGSQDSAGSIDDLSVECDPRRKNCTNSTTKTAMAMSKDERISITLTKSSGPSKSFMTNLRTTDLNMVNYKQYTYM